MELRNINRHAVELRIGDQPPLFLDGAVDEAFRISDITQAATAVTVGVVTIPVVTVSKKADAPLPDPEPGVLLVTNQLVCQQFPERRDLVFPFPVVPYPRGHAQQGQAHYAAGLGQVPAPR